MVISNDKVHDRSSYHADMLHRDTRACRCEQCYLTKSPGRHTIPRAVLCPPAALLLNGKCLSMPAAAITYHNDDHESIQQPTQCIALQLTELVRLYLQHMK